MSQQYVDYQNRDGAAWLTLSNGDRGNPIHRDSVAALAEAVDRAHRDAARVIVLGATGRFFCVGGDLSAFAGAEDPGGYVHDLADHLHRVVARLIGGDQVVVSVVQGPAAGAGFPLAAAADLVLAGRRASFTLAYTNAGLSVDGGTSMLTHTLGLHRMLRLALLNDTLSAEEAHAAGLVARVVDDADLSATAEQVVARLLAGPRHAFAATKRMLRDVAAVDPVAALAAETRSISRLANTPDGREGVAAFLAKRPPQYPG